MFVCLSVRLFVFLFVCLLLVCFVILKECISILHIWGGRPKIWLCDRMNTRAGSLNHWVLPLPLPIALAMQRPKPLSMQLQMPLSLPVLPIKYEFLKEKWQWWDWNTQEILGLTGRGMLSAIRWAAGKIGSLEAVAAIWFKDPAQI